MPPTATVRSRAKAWLQVRGLYPAARHWYRRLHPAIAWERAEEGRFLRPFVAPGDLCMDIGANLGQTVDVLLDLGARVVAVEPNPNCLRTLHWEFGRRDDVVLVPEGLAAEAGRATLRFDGTDSTGSMRDDWPFPNRSALEVPVTTLDALIATHGRPTFCKIDVEGFELEVLRGLSRPIPTLCFEFYGREPERSIACLEVLERLLGGATARIANLGTTTWVTPEWVDVARMAAHLRVQTLEWGNLFVRAA